MEFMFYWVTRKMFPFDDVIMLYKDTVKPVCNDHLYNKIYYL